MASGSEDELRHLLEKDDPRNKIIERGNHLQKATTSTDRLREHLQRHAALAKVLREKEEKKSRFGKWKFGKKKKHRQVVRETENVPVEDDTVGSLIGDSCVESLRSAEIYGSHNVGNAENDDHDDDDDDDDDDHHHHQYHHNPGPTNYNTLTDVINRDINIDIGVNEMISRAEVLSGGTEDHFKKITDPQVIVSHHGLKMTRKFIITVTGVLCVVAVVVVIVILFIFHPWRK